MKVWVVAEQKDGQLRRVSRELAAKAATMGDLTVLRVTGATPPHRAAVVQDALAVVGAEGRGQHQGAVDIGPEGRLAEPRRGDRAMAAVVPVE